MLLGKALELRPVLLLSRPMQLTVLVGSLLAQEMGPDELREGDRLGHRDRIAPTLTRSADGQWLGRRSRASSSDIDSIPWR